MESRRKPRSSWSRATTELVASGPAGSSTGRTRRRRPLAGSAALGVTGTQKEPVRPRVEARGVAELREVPPDGEQGLLRRVLGEVDVAQDPVRHGMEAVAHGDSEAREGLLIAALRPDHQVGVHASPIGSAAGATPTSYGQGATRDGPIFVDGRLKSRADRGSGGG